LTPQNNPHPPHRLTADQIEVRIWAFVVVVVMFVFAGITGSMLYSVIFVVQPIKSMAPIDQAFTKMLNDVVLLIVGGIGGIMSKRAVSEVSRAIAGPPPAPAASPCPPVPPSAPLPNPAAQNWNWMGFVNPQLDETWVPPPPPTTPPEYIPPEAADIAAERAAARGEV